MSFKICTIGCGLLAKNAHGPAYRKYAAVYPDIILAACCDIDGEKAADFKRQFGFLRCYTDIDTMLDTERPDVVCLVVPVNHTARLAVHVLEKGYPLILEKPPGLNIDETLRIKKAAEKKQIPAMVAFNRRFMPLVIQLKKLLSDYSLPGEIQSICHQMYRAGRKEPEFHTTAIHAIDTIKFLAGSDFRHVSFRYQELSSIGYGVANIFMDCEFESGAAAQLCICPVAGVVIERTAVNVYNHTFFADFPVWGGFDAPGRLVHIENTDVKLNLTGKDICNSDEMFETNGFYAENESFFNDIQSGKMPECDLISALQPVEIANCIKERKVDYRKHVFI